MYVIPIYRRTVGHKEEQSKEPEREYFEDPNIIRLVERISSDRKLLKRLAHALAPQIAQLEQRFPRVWGDAKRIHIKTQNSVNDLLLNTRSGHIYIEEDCFFGPRCMLLTGTHDYAKTGRDRLVSVPTDGRDIHLKRGVWLGAGVIVLGPCTIGENAVVAAGSLVRSNVPSNCLVAGRPAKIVKEIDFGEDG